MASHVCPWWVGYLLANPLRRLMQDPAQILAPYVHPGMTVLEPGPGMGFFTLELARLVGPGGRVIAVDLQPRMLDGLRRRADKAQLDDRIETRLAQTDSLDVADLREAVDFVLAFAVVHETPDAAAFFAQVAATPKVGGHLLLAEPKGHVDTASFEVELNAATQAGLTRVAQPDIRRSHAALLCPRAQPVTSAARWMNSSRVAGDSSDQLHE